MKRKAHGGAGSGSDGEATAGEMSDSAGPKKKIKLKGSGGRGTPSASRAGSPNPPQGSKCRVSPNPMVRFTNSSVTGPPPGSPSRVVEPSEILDRIPPEGITIGELIKFFAGRVGEKPGQMPKQDWIGLVKGLCDYGADKRLRKKS